MIINSQAKDLALKDSQIERLKNDRIGYVLAIFAAGFALGVVAK